jgi:acetate kinase
MTPDSAPSVLALNSGSSSLKFGLYRVGPARTDVLLSGEVESIGSDDAEVRAQDSRANVVLLESASIPSQRDAVIRIGRVVADSGMPAPAAIGHRIVHGGPKLREHCRIDDHVVRQLEAATAFAPLHIPSALSVIRFAREHFAGVPQIACFDTTFHCDLAEVARVLPISRGLQSEGIQRYGFHGLSCESIVHQLAGNLPDRLVVAHLGNGASVTAIKDGKSIDTSMGLTPTGGVIMGTRSGDLDPGILVYLMREKKFDAAMLEELVDHRSGLLGISGVGSDMRRLHEAASSNADARLAIDMFCYSVRKQAAAMIAALDGADMIVFTGGIGENDAEVRAAICSGLSWIGVNLDEGRNRSAHNPISAPESRCSVLVLPSQEDEQIARHTRELYAPEFGAR